MTDQDDTATAALPLPPQATAVATLPVAQICASPSNPRRHFDDAYLDELAESIKAQGIIQPITVRPNPRGVPLYELVVGECRWRASQRAGLDEIPAFWRELDDKQVLEIQVVENLQRRDVHPIEEAEGYEQLMKKHGYKAESLAAKIGKSKAYVYARLKLTALCRDAREAAYAGKLDASTALLIARIPGEKLQQKAVKEITEPKWQDTPYTYRQAVNHIRSHFTLSLQQATFPLHDATLVPAAGSCADCPKRSGNDPAIYADIDDADVCTDTTCYQDKREARHLQLLALAEQRQIPVLQGDAAREVAPFGLTSKIDRSRYVMLDDVAEDDAEGRTYREILGDDAPTTAMVEVGYNNTNERLVEVADTTAMQAALEAAGWTPSEAAPTDEETPEQSARRAALAAEQSAAQAARERQKQAIEAENTWRRDLWAALIGDLRCRPESGGGSIRSSLPEALRTLAFAYLRQTEKWCGIYDSQELLDRHGLPQLPDEYEPDEEIARIHTQMAGWSSGQLLAFLLDALMDHERTMLCRYVGDTMEPPRSMLAVAKLLGFDAESLRPAAPPTPAEREEGSVPTQAAQAQEVSACDAAPAPEEQTTAPAAPAEEKETPAPKAKAKGKGKAKTNPAPAAPANEPAAPVETPA